MRSQKAYLLYRGCHITLGGGFHARALWPPRELPRLIAEKAIKKLEPVYEKAKKLIERAKDIREKEVRELAETIEQQLGANTSEEKHSERRELEPTPEPREPPPILPTFVKREEPQREWNLSKEEQKLLESIGDAVNDLSLVLKYYYRSHALALIPGDNPEYVLDHLSQLEHNEPAHHKHIVFLRGAHHGTYYGRYMEEHKTIITWLSWTAGMRQKPHPGYTRNTILTMLADTYTHVDITVDLTQYIILIGARTILPHSKVVEILLL